MIHAEKRRKAENPRKSPKKSYAEKRRKAKNPRNREKAPVLRALGERKKERERWKYARSHIYNKKETGALPR